MKLINRPNIKLLSYKDNLFFLYDANCNEIKNISRKTYILLNTLMLDRQNTVCDFEKTYAECDEIKELIKEGYLKSEYPRLIEQPLNRYLINYVNHRVNGIVLQVTQNCNLKCKYCTYANNGLHGRKHTTKRMDWDTAKKAVDFLRDHSNELSHIRISFYGGEPLLNFSLIKKTVLYAEEIMPYKQISFAMTTNLTILSNDVILFLKQHNFHLTVSLDGPRDVNDKNRFWGENGESSFDRVIGNLKKLSEDTAYYTKYVQINSVVDKSVDRAYISSFFKNNDLFRNIKIGYSTVNDSNLAIQYYSSPQYIRREKTIVLKDMIGRIVDKTDIDDSFDEIIQRLSVRVPFSKQKFVHPNGPCLPGIKKLFINVDGDFYPCEKANEMSSHLKIGCVEKGMNIEKIKEIYNIGKINENECKSCWAIRLCSCCAVNIDDGKSISGTLKEKRCYEQRKILEKELVQLGIINLITSIEGQ